MSEFNFKSQPYTTIEQSQRLIALGLKVETADCCHWFCISCVDEPIEGENIPAWSLHRLIEMVAHTQYPYYVISELPIYDALCERIEWLIKDGCFPKEYLQEQAGSSREE